MAKKKSVARPSKVQTQVFILRVVLEDTTPSVWRTVVVPGFFTLEALHSVIQIVMGWRMSHLYDFQVGKNRFTEPDDFDEMPVKSVSTTIAAAFKGEQSITYNYDFGDSWRHTIFIESTTNQNAKMSLPVCIAGENACPPEDCGGTDGFETLKETISSPKNEDFNEMMQWLGGFYSPYSFDANRINRDLLWTINWDAEPNDHGLYMPFSALNSSDVITF